MNSTPKAFLQIKSQYSNFNPTEKKIADYILNNPQELIYSTISQIGDKLKLADSTIFRFCKKIDFKGFHDLKISLATDVVKETKITVLHKFSITMMKLLLSIKYLKPLYRS